MMKNNVEHFFEIKTAKPNTDIFARSKIKLLEWDTRRQTRIKVYLAFPYNPYHPAPYRRFSEVGIMNPPNDLLVGKEFWDFLGGSKTYNDLLRVFDEIGILYKEKLKEKFKELAKIKYENN